MTMPGNHPDDFSPYLDRDLSDPKYEEIARHITTCNVCAEEVGTWQSMEATFRNPALEIEVPAFQWARIKSNLATAPRLPWAHRILRTVSLRPMWAAAAVFLVLALAVSDMQYMRYLDRNERLALRSYALAEKERLAAAQNPFRIDDASNPFARIQDYADTDNPFVNR